MTKTPVAVTPYSPVSWMTIRAHFAAHAPEPQHWFEPVMPTPLPQSTWDHDHEQCGSENSSRLPWECIPSNKADRDAWFAEQEKQRLIQWPWAWADEVLRAGGIA